MPNTGYQWSAWDYFEVGAVDVDDTDLNDETTLTTDAVSLNITAAIEIGVKWTEGGDGAVDGDLYVYILGDTGDQYETISDAPLGFAIDVVASATRVRHYTVSSGQYSTIKVLVDNDSGQDGDLTLQYKLATIPVAS